MPAPAASSRVSAQALRPALILPPAFPLPLELKWVAPRRGVFLASFAFDSAEIGRITVEPGFDTDFASVPRGLWNLYPPDGDYSPAAFIHDALYWHHATEENGRPVTRAQADAVFLEAMTALGIGWITRRILHRAVRLGGEGPRQRARRERLGLPEPTLETINNGGPRLFRRRK